MNPHRFALSVCLSFLFCATLPAQEGPPEVMPTKEHQWLGKFVGEWETESEMIPGPGQPPITCSGKMTSRALGEVWVISELHADAFGTRFDAIQSLGYDPKKKKFVGTWIDSVSTHMWKYEGSLDESGAVLSLDAEGPNFAGNGEMATFRDAYEFKSNDHIVLTSSILGENGEWTTFMTGHFRRAKQ